MEAPYMRWWNLDYSDLPICTCFEISLCSFNLLCSRGVFIIKGLSSLSIRVYVCLYEFTRTLRRITHHHVK